MITSSGEEVVVPVLLRIQDGWMLPLILLLFGVGMGMAVSAYSTGGKLSDEVTVGLKRLRSQVNTYHHEAKTFAVRVETYISDAESANEAKQLTEAQAAVSQANLIWRKWYRQRTEWEAQFTYHHQLVDQVNQELDHYPSLYIQTISRELDDMMRRTPEDFADPSELRIGLQGVANKLRKYGQVKTQWNRLKELVSHEFERIPAVEQKKINADINAVRQLITSVIPSDTEEISDLKTRLTTLITAIKNAANTTIIPILDVASDGDDEDNGSETRERIVSKLTMIPSPIVEKSVKVERSPSDVSWLEKVQDWVIWPDADGRLRSFYIASYIGSVVMLASVGFSSLYVENPVFGANFFADYFSIVAWGFGAEATRDTVTKVVRKTDQTNQ
ncbi:MAG: hypothetical protein F6K09_17535 [Merismopedia sp. SIO2A8]|nr:hypothetical protein [Merismopedia sp. SIO2A8]